MQFLRDGAAGPGRLQDDLLFAQQRQQVRKAGSQVAMTAQSRGMAVALRQMRIQELLDEESVLPKVITSCSPVQYAADDRQALVQLCRYISRPAPADERVEINAAGQGVLKLKTPWREGTIHLVMSPLEFMHCPVRLSWAKLPKRASRANAGRTLVREVRP